MESPKKKQNEKTGEGGERNIRQMSHFINQSTNSLENLSISPKGSNTDQSLKELYGNIGIPFLEELHLKYIDKLRQNTQSFDQIITEHLKVSAVYWALCTLAIMNRDLEKEMECTKVVDWVMQCYDPESGGFGGNVGHDPHLLYTLSALQILAIAGRIDILNEIETEAEEEDQGNYETDRCKTTKREKIIKYIVHLQQEDGSFAGDKWGEIDTRFTYCAVSALSLLGHLYPPNYGQQRENNSDQNLPITSSHVVKEQSNLDFEEEDIQGKGKEKQELGYINAELASEFILNCMNFDGGFGCIPGAESHAGQVFTCVGALAILGSLEKIDADLLGWWLCERQCDSGGLNGRPEKQADVCYSWWILSSLVMIGRSSWISRRKLATFILECQDNEDGGIADRPGNLADIFHTYFGVAGLSLLHYFECEDLNYGGNGKESTLKGNSTSKKNSSSEFTHYIYIDPVYALPSTVVEKLQLKSSTFSELES